MRMKKIVENRTLKGAAAEFLAFKRAQKIRERTLHDYEKYINTFMRCLLGVPNRTICPTTPSTSWN